MNTTQIKGFGMMAAAMADANDWRVIDGEGRVVMFGISQARAEEYARYYKGGKAVQG